MTCEREGKPSVNAIKFYAVNSFNFTHPDQLEMNKAAELTCDFDIRPTDDLSFMGLLSHKSKDNNGIILARFYYNITGTQISEDGKDFLEIIPGKDNTRFSVTVKPLSKSAEGNYSCSIFVGGILYPSTIWQVKFSDDCAPHSSGFQILTNFNIFIYLQLFLYLIYKV